MNCPSLNIKIISRIWLALIKFLFRKNARGRDDGELKSRLTHKDSQFPLGRQPTALKLPHGKSFVVLQGTKAKVKAFVASRYTSEMYASGC